MSALKAALKLVAGLPVLLVGIAFMKLIGFAESIYPLRKRLVRRGYLVYSKPDSDTIRECECGYRGVLRVDKYRPEPMSDINWGLYCPECDEEHEGPLLAEDVGEYVNHSRNSDVMGGLVEIGNYAAFKAVQSHNSRYALPEEKIEALAMEARK